MPSYSLPVDRQAPLRWESSTDGLTEFFPSLRLLRMTLSNADGKIQSLMSRAVDRRENAPSFHQDHRERNEGRREGVLFIGDGPKRYLKMPFPRRSIQGNREPRPDDLKKAEKEVENILKTPLDIRDDHADVVDMSPVGSILNRFENRPLLTREEEIALANKYRTGTEGVRKRVKEEFAARNIGVVLALAARYRGKSDLEFDDLVQVGLTALTEAIEGYKPDLGYKFLTYAFWKIRGAMQRAVNDYGRGFKLPASVFRQKRILEKADQRALETGLPVGPTIEKRRKRLEGLESFRKGTLSLNATVGEEGDTELGDLIADVGQVGPDEIVARNQLSEELKAAMELLTDSEREVLRLRYGLEDGVEHTLDDAGRQMGLTINKIKYIEKSALKKLRRSPGAISLRHFLG